MPVKRVNISIFMIAFLGVIGVTMFYGTTLGACRKFGLLISDDTLSIAGLLFNFGIGVSLKQNPVYKLNYKLGLFLLQKA